MAKKIKKAGRPLSADGPKRMHLKAVVVVPAGEPFWPRLLKKIPKDVKAMIHDKPMRVSLRLDLTEIGEKK